MRGSLLSRILMVEALTILAACIIVPLLARQVLTSSVSRIEDGLLRGQADAVAQGLAPAPGGGWRVNLGESGGAIYATGYDGRAYAVVDARGGVVAASRFALPARWPPRLYGLRPKRFDTGSLMGMAVPVASRREPLWVVVTQDQTQPGAVVDDVVRVFLSRYLWAVVALLALMLLINGVALWHSFSSLRAVALAAGRIGPRSLHERLDETGLPAEAHALVHATNGLLDRVQAALHLREEFAGNVAHELRTPLSALRVQLARVEDAGLREGLVRQVERMSHVLAQLFDLASLDGAAAAAMAPLDFSALSIDIVAELTPAILDSGRSIALADALGDAGEPLLARANRGLIEIALRNLIDNAVKHTPKGSRIEVCLERGEKGEVSLAVADDGPGIAGNEAGQLARRFWRADQRRSDGAGLGLSIVQRIASVHEGRLEVGVSRWGGALFSLVVPGLMPDGG